VGHILLLRNAVRMLSDLPSLDDVLWPASEMLRLSPHVLCNCYHEHDYGHHDPYDPMAYDMEVTDAFTAKGCCYWNFPSRWTVSLDMPQPRTNREALLTVNSVCGISIARLVFFVPAGQGFDNAYDVTCKSRSGRNELLMLTVLNRQPCPNHILDPTRSRACRHQRVSSHTAPDLPRSLSRESSWQFPWQTTRILAA